MRKESFDGPKELAEKLSPLLDPKVAHIDDLPHLLQLLYHASLIPEEGRYPRFRVICSSSIYGHSIEFEQPWPPLDSVEAFRRLAPAVSDPNTALMVSGNARHGFIANNIIDFWEHSIRGDAATGYWRADDALPDGTLTIRVDGPGQLRASVQPGPVLHLRGGRIRELTAFDKAVTPFRDIVTTLCRQMKETLHATIGEVETSQEILEEEFLGIWSAMMSDAIHARHGAAFVVLPNLDCHCAKPKYRATCKLFEAFQSTAELVLKLKPEDIRSLWLLHREHVLRVARMAGRLSATDGAVLFDRRLAMIGFGAKLHSSEAKIPLFLAGSDTEIGDQRFSGMRHKSAANLVQAVPGTIVFVVSQDGDLSAFGSNEKRAEYFPHLDAWSSVSDFL